MGEKGWVGQKGDEGMKGFVGDGGDKGTKVGDIYMYVILAIVLLVLFRHNLSYRGRGRGLNYL